jgi:hypothetical protein
MKSLFLTYRSNVFKRFCHPSPIIFSSQHNKLTHISRCCLIFHLTECPLVKIANTSSISSNLRNLETLQNIILGLYSSGINRSFPFCASSEVITSNSTGLSRHIFVLSLMTHYSYEKVEESPCFGTLCQGHHKFPLFFSA